MIRISFGWTAPAFIARQKTVTRRDWKPAHAARFKTGQKFCATDRASFLGGKPIGAGRLLQAPYLELSSEIPYSDWQAEGFEYLTQIGALVNGMTPKALWDLWHTEPRLLYVVRYEVVA